MYNSISLQPYLTEVTFRACFVNTQGNYHVRGLVYISGTFWSLCEAVHFPTVAKS